MNSGLVKPDIVEVVARNVTLRSVGKNLRGLCPFHAERTPSFFVNPTSQTFHCFGCGAKGDVIAYEMRSENLDFKGACKHLGIELKPGLKSLKELREKKAIASFREWCKIYDYQLFSLYHELQDTKRLADSMEDVERLSPWYHLESVWLQRLEILWDGNDKQRFELFREVTHG